jgi:hypothetical protein
VWCANEKERGEGTSTKDTQSAMEGKHGGRALKTRGKRRRRADDKGQDWEGNTKRVVEGEGRC